MKSGDKRQLNGISYKKKNDKYEHNEEIRLNQSQCHALVRRYSMNAKGMLCGKCTSVMNDKAEKIAPLFSVYGLLLLIRRDCGRDFDVCYEGRHLQLRIIKVQDLDVPVLLTEQHAYYSTNILFRHGCKAHSVWDRRTRSLHDHISSMPIGTDEATMTAVAKIYFGAGFKVKKEAEQKLSSSMPSAAKIKNASEMIEGDCSAEDVHTYFSYARDDEGNKKFLAPFAMIALMLLQAIPMLLILFFRRAVDTLWTTSWGPCAAVNHLLGKKKFRYYSPQETTNGRRKTSSMRARDKRLVTGTVIVLSLGPFGKLIHDIFRAMNVPWGFAGTISFLLCEARKYYAENVAQYRQRFQDPAMRQRFVADLMEQLDAGGLLHQSSDIGSFLTVEGSDEFITPSDDEEDTDAESDADAGGD